MKVEKQTQENTNQRGQEWFEVWFDTPEYHLLYKHRDMDEAAVFIRNIIQHLGLPENSRVLDLACGRGRHTLQLAGFGYEVFGLDYAPGNITYALEHHSRPNTTYFLHDMRLPFPVSSMDLILNLFTSFGYFNDRETHEQVLLNIRGALKPGGIFIMDYFNSARVLNDMVHKEEKWLEGTLFTIQRRKTDHRIVKHIEVKHRDGVIRHFEEWVEAFSRSELENLLESTGFQVQEVFGDYALRPFDEQHSPRLILKCKVQ